MANYEAPPDPRKSDLRERRPRRQRSDGRDLVPLVGLLFGAAVTLLAIIGAWQLVKYALAREPLDVAALEPTIVLLTAPATRTPTPTPPVATPTAIPTLTPQPTEDISVAPAAVRVGFYAAVADTGGVGLSVRGGPSTDNVKLMTADEGTVVLVIDGPTEGSGFTWWKVLLDDGTEGWMAARFLVPAAAPDGVEN